MKQKHDDPGLMIFSGMVVLLLVMLICYGITIVQRDEAAAEAADLRAQVAALEAENEYLYGRLAERANTPHPSPAANLPTKNQPEAQRSGFGLERRHDGASATASVSEADEGGAPGSSRPTTRDERQDTSLVGTFRVTHYCTCAKCCGVETGITASGRPAEAGFSVAVDPTVIPLGTRLLLDYGDGVLHEARADDTGGAVKGQTLDLCVADHATALTLGVREATVYIEEDLK